MTVALLPPSPKFTAIDVNGDPYVGAKLYTYETGTTTPKTTWKDASKSAANTNPVILDSKGQADIWIDSADGAYRYKLVDPDDVTLWTIDNVIGVLGAVVGLQLREAYALAAGTDTYSVSLDTTLTVYTTGDHYFITFGNTNTSTTPTLNIDSLGAKTIKNKGGGALSPGSISDDHPSILKYDGTDLILLNPVVIDDTAYDATTWDGVLSIGVSKNAIRDKVVLMDAVDAGKAAKGANADITSMSGLSNDGIPLAKVANAASDGVNSDITSLAGLTTPITKAQGGSGTTGDSIIKGWVKANVAGAIQDSFNVASIADTGAGLVTITWDTNFANTNYSCVGTAESSLAIGSANLITIDQGSQAVGSIVIGGSNSADAAVLDPAAYHVIAMGDQ